LSVKEDVVKKEVKQKEETFKEAVVFTGGIDSTLLLNEVKDRPNREVIPLYFSNVTTDDKRRESINYFLKKFGFTPTTGTAFGSYYDILMYCYQNKINKLNIAFNIEDDANKQMIDLRMMNEDYLRELQRADPNLDPKTMFVVDIVAPYITLTKSSIIEMAKDKGIEIEKTPPPYYEIVTDKATGKNVYTDASLIRKRIRDKAFADARVQDPHGLIPKNLNPNK
jgi:7-cyano-7-deazaguanine synthase in queuosine biosynthesis